MSRGREGAVIHPEDASPLNCVACPSADDQLTVRGIPVEVQRKHALKAIELARYLPAADSFRFRSGAIVPVAACVGVVVILGRLLIPGA